ncbi:mannose-6-phosphate isomerase, type 1 [Candidatus Koribacter versatilis Ellin345]|uniref:Mannose-6-phosphate isomerase, type 1 n=1 Tax=Koribacter versatilis (strain Ellin345) TaxID=204669 RepID=Q1IU76_KORVE|nr:type I phosphomannose isomerase catalytic subunit [Candidatus Koribacter versatilis]ABF39574.1 mannose-6-phosphate isomerase, type 1 [Candidatus Koribacter versatilis Ellin345]
MADLHPFLLAPEFHERIWGTRDLRPIYTRIVGDNPIGEAWLTGEKCKVASGPLKGETLETLCKRFGAALTGNKAKPADRFPLLAKFLFPHEKLSVQVHPDDARAQAIGQPWGKTECWYVASAEPGAQVMLGFKAGVTKQEFEQAIHEKRAEHLLNAVPVQTGDMIYVDAGTVHAICPGAVIIETQQNSDTTYRLYDYGRPRELHVEAGLASTKEKTHAGKVKVSRNGNHDVLIASPSFCVERYSLKSPLKMSAEERGASVQVLVSEKGTGVLHHAGIEPIAFTPGEAVVVPAECDEFEVQPQWECELLRMNLPAHAVPEPTTTLL